MRRLLYIFVIGTLLTFTSCAKDVAEYDTMRPARPMPSGNGLQIVGAVEEFDEQNVGTRADEEVPDSHISEMTMFIFKANGDLLQGYDANQNAINSAINIQKPNPTFLIETSRYDGTGILASMDGDQSMMKYYNNKAGDLAGCSIYIVANAWDQLTAQGLVDGDPDNGEITSLAELQAVLLDVDATLDMPKKADGTYLGFPMIGTHDSNVKFDLSYNADNTSGVATIPLKKLYSKVRFRMQVNSKQVVHNGPTPKFIIDNVKVYNIPTKVRMGYSTDVYANAYQFKFTSEEPFVMSDASCFSKRTIYHSSSATTNDVIEFGFYMPEHKVIPNNNVTYPSHMPSDLYQYYKPHFFGGTSSQIAPFVRIDGSYTDHNGQIHKVEYDVYLGQNNYNDFEVKRNQQLNNHLTITGITNHKDAYSGGDNISVDHRVSVAAKGYNIYMEREAILDSHFEVRPIDIELQANSSMNVIIPYDYRSWIAMESETNPQGAADVYVNTTDERKMVRKYFTQNLVKELTEGEGSGNWGTITLDNNTNDAKIFRIWFYIDENPNVYDKTKTGSGLQTGESDYTVSDVLYRNAPVEFWYSPKIEEDKTLIATINFQQWNLWRVWGKDKNGTVTGRYYDIEHEEEYLNNYASDQNYGNTKVGIQWGFDDVVFSDALKSFYLETSFSTISNALMEESKPYYDFYINEAEANGTSNYRPFSGREFSNDIMSKLLYETLSNASGNTLNNANYISSMTLPSTPLSAVEYCYNKNKRLDDGDIIKKNDDGYDTSNVRWYLPAIDEMEEIAMGAYDEFDKVFQNNYYWSSQPAYDRYKYNYNAQLGWVDAVSGVFYQDDVSNARATSVLFSDGGWSVVTSGSDEKVVSNTVGTHTWTSVAIWVVHSYSENDDYSQDNLDAGNQPRTKLNRVRAVYRSGVGEPGTTTE